MRTVKPPWSLSGIVRKTPIIFLAGGISNCPNWQELATANMEAKFSDKNFVLANPRRDDFDTMDANMTLVQIKWEHHWLERSSIIFFWFPKDTLCPITLFELGCYLENRKKILVVGCDPQYKRLTDVVTQSKLRRPRMEVHVGFDNFLQATEKYLKKLDSYGKTSQR